MRLKSHIWVSAYLRRLDSSFMHGVVVRRGDADAGAIYIKVSLLDGKCHVLAPISAALSTSGHDDNFFAEDGRAWQILHHATLEAEADAYLTRQASQDPDLWILEIESPTGKHLLGESAYASA